MAKIKIHSKYGVTPNELLNNKDVTLKAKGLYAYIQSKSDDWDFSAEKIASQSKESVDAIKTGLRELESVGYLQRIKVHNEKGYFETEYILYEKPIQATPTKEKPAVDFPTLDNGTDNSKKDLSKKDIKNKDFKKEISKEILPSVLENEKLRLEIEELKKQLLDTEKKERKISVKKKERFEPPTVEEVENYFIENGFRKESGTKAYNYYSVADWQDSKGSKVKNWKQKMQAVWFKDENKQNTSYARNTSTNPTTIVIDENGNTKQSNSEFRPFGLDNNRQEGKPLLRFVNPANVPSFGYVRPTDEVVTGE